MDVMEDDVQEIPVVELEDDKQDDVEKLLEGDDIPEGNEEKQKEIEVEMEDIKLKEEEVDAQDKDVKKVKKKKKKSAKKGFGAYVSNVPYSWVLVISKVFCISNIPYSWVLVISKVVHISNVSYSWVLVISKVVYVSNVPYSWVLYPKHSKLAEASSLKLYRVSVFKINN